MKWHEIIRYLDLEMLEVYVLAIISFKMFMRIIARICLAVPLIVNQPEGESFVSRSN